MNPKKKIYLWVALVIFITGSITVSASALLTQDIHVLIVSDDGNPRTGKQHGADKDRIEGLMKSSVALMLEVENPAAMINIDELLSSDRQLTKNNIFGWLRNVNPGADDVVFVYFSGRGGADKTDAKERFLYGQDDEKLYRKEIATLMAGMQCRLKILITEAHSVGPPATTPMQSTNTRRTVDLGATATLTETDVLRQLFLEHKGFLNLTSTSLGYMSLGYESIGGYFTASLMNAIIPDAFEDVDQFPQDGFVSWMEVFEFTKEDLSEFYEASAPDFLPSLKERLKRLNQTTQVPEVLSDFPTSGSTSSDPIPVSVPEGQTQDIHVLMVIDDANPKTEKLRTIDRYRITALMENHVGAMLEKQRPGATVKVMELLSKDNQAKKDNIFNWLQNVNPGPDEIIFVYLSGPGGVDEAGTKGHFLLVQGEKLYRNEMATLIGDMQCRLKIFITDTYNEIPDIPPLPEMSVHGEDILNNLFFEHEGFLNLNSSALGQIAISGPRRGGYFTASLMNGMFPWDMDMIDRKPQDGFVSWEEVFEFTKEDMDFIYEVSEPNYPSSLKDTLKQYNQTTQTPEVLSDFPKRIH